MGTFEWREPGALIGSPDYSYLRLDGSSAYAAAPDQAAFDIAGDIEATINFAADDWTPAVTQAILTNHSIAPFGGYEIRHVAGGGFGLVWGQGGVQRVSGTVTGGALVDGQSTWLRFRRVVSTGAFSVEQSSDGVSFTLIGSISNQIGIGIDPSALELAIGKLRGGSSWFAGNIRELELRDGIAGTIIASPDFTTRPGATSFTDAQGNVWTLSGAAVIPTQGGGRSFVYQESP